MAAGDCTVGSPCSTACGYTLPALASQASILAGVISMWNCMPRCGPMANAWCPQAGDAASNRAPGGSTVKLS